MPAKTVGMKSFTKQLHSFKSISPGMECTPEMLAKINCYALKELKVEDVYVRKFLMAHNCIDRDNECFPSEMLDQFAATMPGKSMLANHDRRSTPFGKWFDAWTEEMSPEQFKTMTNEEPQLPNGADKCKVLFTSSYMLNKAYNAERIDNLDAGITGHCSIGFAAADLTAVRESPTGPAKYWQYISPGEALEGSLVWLGAQPGATAQKALQPESHERQEEKSMKELLARLGKALGLSKALEEDGVIEAVTKALEAKDTQIAELKALEPLAAEGTAYRKSLVADAVKFGTLIEEITGDADAQKKESDFLATLPLDRLKMTRDKYESKAREKFPTHTIFTGKDQSDREQRGKEGEQRQTETKGKKDFSSPAHNELFKTVGR